MGFYKNTASGREDALNRDKINEKTGETFAERWERLVSIDIDKIENFNGHIEITDGEGTELYDECHEGHSLKYIGGRYSVIGEQVAKVYNIPNPNKLTGCIKGHTNKLLSLTMPDTIIRIEAEAFVECTSLKSITLSKSLEYIGERAFASCAAIKEVELPASVTDIGNNAFANCTSLRKITVPERFREQLLSTGITDKTEVTFI